MKTWGCRWDLVVNGGLSIALTILEQFTCTRAFAGPRVWVYIFYFCSFWHRGSSSVGIELHWVPASASACDKDNNNNIDIDIDIDINIDNDNDKQ